MDTVLKQHDEHDDDQHDHDKHDHDKHDHEHRHEHKHDHKHKHEHEHEHKHEHHRGEHDHDHGHDHDHDHKHDHKHDHDDWKDRYEKEKCYEEYRLHHIYKLEKTIKELADSLARLGRGAHLHDLLRIIHKPGWTTKAELAFVNAILEHIGVQVRALDHLQHDLVEAARKVTYEYKDKYDHK
jgi:hypothetical protein